jgi:glucosamine--fructose-6-phosphate aminotransferase (isomerizing)
MRSAVAHVLIGGEREILLAKQMSAFGVPVLLITDTPQSLPSVETLILPPLQRLALELLAMELLAIHLGAVLGRDIDAGIVERLDTKINGETL